MKYDTGSSITSCIIRTNIDIDNENKMDMATMAVIDTADKILDLRLIAPLCCQS
jgi:hypothetical protein